MMVSANIVISAMAVTFILLAVQAEPVTAFFGYLFGFVLFLAVIRQTMSSTRGDNAGKPNTEK